MTPIVLITELYAFPRNYAAENIIKRIKYHFLIEGLRGIRTRTKDSKYLPIQI
jgi:hypothetical protein